MKITFRKATPKDVEAAVPLIYSSGPVSFEYAFQVAKDKAAQDFLKYAFVRSGSEFSYTNHTCMIDEAQEVVGIGAAFSEEDVNGFTFSAVKYIFAHYGFFKGLKVVHQGLQVEKVIPPPKGNTEVLAHLGIRPDKRGLGLGTQLIDYFIDAARKKGRATASLDVSVENPKAKALYDRLGFVVTSEGVSNLKNEFSYVANHYKMFRDIGEK